jgi:hypothetical protein
VARLDEILSEQFARWEGRGRGWKVWPHPVPPEPPFRPFLGYRPPRTDPKFDDGRKPGLLASLFDRIHESLNPKPPIIPEPEEVEPEPEALERDRLVELQTLLPANLDIKSEAFADFLSQLALCREPITFELLGTAKNIAAQFVSHPSDTPILSRQLKSYFPEVAFLSKEEALVDAWIQSEAETAIVEFGLEREFLLPLATGQKLDPFLGLIGAMSELEPGELALFQVIFEGTEHDWKQNALRTIADVEGNPTFVNRPELVEFPEEKFASPIYGAVVRIATKAAQFDQAWQIARELACALRLFARPEGNALIPLHNEGYPFEAHEEDVLLRQSRRSGMLLNTDELMGFVHFPASSVRSPNLLRQTERTKSAPESLAANREFILGENQHLGSVVTVGLSPDERVRHTHIIGTPGSGKSTFIFNLIRQDIDHGRGLAVLDPHGDLINRILGCIPKERINDVVLVDPSDEDYSIGFNILAAHSDLEKTLLSSDLVAVFRRLSTSWGDQMGSVLRNAILAFLESSRGGTLADMQRFLIDPAFRTEFLSTVQDPEIIFYWRKGFDHLSGKKSIGPLLTRLSEFLSPKPIRYMVSQKANRLDFAGIMNTGKIFLAKLPQGTMGSENSSLMGSFFMAKFHLAAMSRQSLSESARRDFFVYLDEAHHFATPSMAEILTGARKYRVGMTLAHQDLAQLDHVKEIASAVLGCATRVVFRVGDSNDARKLSEGFGFFEAKDLQNLEKGQAICRVEKADWDFNLSVPLPKEPDSKEAEATRQTIIAASRTKYATPRKDIAALFETAIIAPVVEPKNIAPPSMPQAEEFRKPTVSEETTSSVIQPVRPAAPPQASAGVPETSAVELGPTHSRKEAQPRKQGKGGAQHTAIQKRIKQAAEELGFRSIIENEVGEGEGYVDLLLKRGSQVIACEISITTTVDHEVGNILKCFEAGYPEVAMIAVKHKHLEDIEEAVVGSIGAPRSEHVKYYHPDQFIAHFEKLPRPTPTPAEPEIRRGYKVKRTLSVAEVQERSRREEVAMRTIAEAMQARPKK